MNFTISIGNLWAFILAIIRQVSTEFTRPETYEEMLRLAAELSKTAHFTC